MLKISKSKNYGSITVSVAVIDQLTKLFAVTISSPIILIKNFLSINFITNTGSAFGILRGQNSLLIFVSLLVFGVILFNWDKLQKHDKFYFSLILGGILGNLIDRLIYGYVVDFISFSFWPAFNIADSALTIGVIGLIYLEYKRN